MFSGSFVGQFVVLVDWSDFFGCFNGLGGYEVGWFDLTFFVEWFGYSIIAFFKGLAFAFSWLVRFCCSY